MNKTLQDFIDGRLVEAIYFDPAKIFGGEWKQRGARKVCTAHILTDGHRGHDGNGTYISSSRPHLLCDGGDPRTNTEVVKYIEQARGCDRLEAARYIADTYGITMPELETETPEDRQRRERREQQERTIRARAISLSKEQPATPEDQPATGAERARRYIAGRGLIDNGAGILYINADKTDAEGKANFDAAEAILTERVNESSRPAGRGTLYKICIPVYSRGRLAGLCYAALPEDMKEAEARATAAGKKAPPKYRLASFADAGTVVFGLRPAKSTRYPWQTRTVVAVEGYFDAITAGQALEEDVVAYLHNYISEDQAKAIAAAGYTSCIIVPDYEGLTAKRTIAEGVNFQANDATDSAKVLRDAGLSVFIADLKDQERPEVKQDANSVTRDILRQRVKEAVTPSTFEVMRLIDIYGMSLGPRVQTEAKARAIYSIATEPDAMTRRALVEYIAPIFFDSREDAAAAVSTEARKIAQQQAIDADRRERQQKAEAYQLASDAIAEGDERTAARLISLGSTSRREAAKLNAFRRPRLFDSVINEAAQRPDGITLPYTATIGVSKPMAIKLPPAGMVVVSAPSGHGKTRFIENMIVHTMQTTPADRRVIYVHFEESDAEVYAHLISIIANVNLNYSDHWNAVIQLVATGRRQPWNSDQDVAAIMEAARTVRNWIDSERLILVDNEPASETITTAIMEAAEGGNLAAVYIDYAQKLKSDAAKFTTKKELMEWACDGVNSLAKQAAVPIILTSQLNRQAVTPWALDIRQNGDATNIEQTAYMNLLVWNTRMAANETATPTTPAYIIDRIQAAGAQIGQPGNILVKVAKNRTGQAGDVWCVLEFTEDTGLITQKNDQL